MSFVAAPDLPPVDLKNPPSTPSEMGDSDSDSTDGSDNDDIPSTLPGTRAVHRNTEHDFEQDILAHFLDDGDESQDLENMEIERNLERDLESTDQPQYLITSDIVDPSEITMEAVQDILSQMPHKIAKNRGTASMLGMQAKRPCIVHASWQGRKIIWERIDNVEAILMQIVGTENPVACKRCTANKGPFAGCYSVPGSHNGGCGCCKYNAQTAKCTLYSGKRSRPQPLRYTSKKRRKHMNETNNNGATANVGANARDIGSTSYPPAAPNLPVQNGNHETSPTCHMVPQPQQRILQVPIPAELGWEDAMTLRRALQEMAEQLVFAPQGNRVVRKVLREFSGALEDFASEEQD